MNFTYKQKQLNLLLSYRKSLEQEIKLFLKPHLLKTHVITAYSTFNDYIKQVNLIDVEYEQNIKDLENEISQLHLLIQRKTVKTVNLEKLLIFIKDLEHTTSYYRSILQDLLIQRKTVKIVNLEKLLICIKDLEHTTSYYRSILQDINKSNPS